MKIFRRLSGEKLGGRKLLFRGAVYRRKLSLLISLTIAFSAAASPFTGNPQTVWAAFGGTGDAVIEEMSAIDILVNSGETSSVGAGEVTEELESEVRERLAAASSDALSALNAIGEDDPGYEEAKKRYELFKGLDSVDVRVASAFMDISTTDLSDWYLYDHYDQDKTSPDKAYSWTEPVKEGPNWFYQPHANPLAYYEYSIRPQIRVARPPFLAYVGSAWGSVMPKMYLEDWVNRTYIDPAKSAELDHTPYNTVSGPKNNGNNGYVLGRPCNDYRNPIVECVAHFDRHIYQHDVEWIPFIDFVGYSFGCLQDFMYYPCESKDEKTVTFEVDAAGVNAHTLGGAGFLINAGLSDDDYQKGYVLLYAFKTAADTAPSKVVLYEIAGNITPLALNDNNANAKNGNENPSHRSISQTGTVQSHIPNVLKVIASADIDGDNWATTQNNTVTEIQLSITPDSLTVQQRPKGSGIWTNPFGAETENGVITLPADTGFNGFGPYVSYIGHVCDQATQFTYSNIHMSYVAQTDEIYSDLLKDHNFVQNTQGFFVDLTDDGKLRNVGSGTEGSKAASYMQSRNIAYITNNPKGGTGYGEIINENANVPGAPPYTGDPTPLGELGLDLSVVKGTGGNEINDRKSQEYKDALVNQIADYVAKRYLDKLFGNADPEAGAPILIETPVAQMQLVSDLNSDGTSDSTAVIVEVRRDLAGAGQKIYGYDHESISASGEEKITKYKYTLVKPDGSKTPLGEFGEMNQGGKDGSGLFTVTNNDADWPDGEYAVEMTVFCGAIESENTARVSFEVTHDQEAPAIPAANISGGALSFTASDLYTRTAANPKGAVGYGIVGYELAVTPGPGGVSIPEYGVFDSATVQDVSGGGKVIGIPVSSADQTASKEGGVSFDNIPLPVGDYSAKLLVYDEAGNYTEVALPRIDYVNELLLADGDISITDAMFGADYKYGAENTAYKNNSPVQLTPLTDTDVTIAVPERPAAPDLHLSVDETNSKSLTNANGETLADADYQYAASAGGTYGSLPGTADENGYYREKAVADTEGETGRFASDPVQINASKVSYIVVFFDKELNEEITRRSVPAGSNVSPPDTPEKDGYAFEEWIDANGAAFDFDASINGALTVYAKWVADSYSVTYHSNEGTGAMEPGEAVHGGSYEIAVNAFSRVGYDFNSWNTLANGKGTAYAAEATISNITGDIDLYAQWTPKTYAIRYHGNEGTGAMESGEAVHGGSYEIAVNAFSRVGYDFDSWNTLTNGKGTAYAAEATISNITGDIDLYAQWTQKTYAVRYHGNEGTGAMESGEAVHGGSYEIAVNVFSRVGYDFDGWNTLANGKGTAYAAEATISNVIGDIDLYAQWTSNNNPDGNDKSYIVTYDLNGGTSASIPNKTVKWTDTGLLPDTEPMRSGYTFAGWYYNSRPVNATDAYSSLAVNDTTQEITLQAQWSEDKYTVKYEINGGTSADIPDKAVNWTDAGLLPDTDPARDGHTFKGWTYEGQPVDAGDTYAELAVSKAVKAVTLKAQWDVITYEVTYYANGGSGAEKSLPVEYGEDHIAEDNWFDCGGYDFDGWNTDEDGDGDTYMPGDPIRNVTDDIDLYAQWAPESEQGVDNDAEYTVTYNANGGNGSMRDDTIPRGEDYLVKNHEFDYDGHIFSGWIAVTSGSSITVSVGDYIRNVQDDIELSAQWALDDSALQDTEYTVAYHKNGGEGSTPDGKVLHGEDYTVEDNGFVYDGHIFAGWNTAEDGKGRTYKPGDLIREVKASVKLYAQWTPDNEQGTDEDTEYMVTYYPNEGLGAMTPDKVTEGAGYTIRYNEFYRVGYDFSGWNTRYNGGGEAYDEGGGVTVKGDIDLYAQWERNIVPETEYVITYHANGGTGTMPADKVMLGDGCTVRNNGFARWGYTFTGWSTKPNGGSGYAAGQTIGNIHGNIDLYAQWKLNGSDVNGTVGNDAEGLIEVTISLKTRGEDAAEPITVKVAHGEAVQYNFTNIRDGWYSVVADSGSDGYTITRDVFINNGVYNPIPEIRFSPGKKESVVSYAKEPETVLPQVEADNLPDMFSAGQQIYDSEDQKTVDGEGKVRFELLVDKVDDTPKALLDKEANAKGHEQVQYVDLKVHKTRYYSGGGQDSIRLSFLGQFYLDIRIPVYDETIVAVYRIHENSPVESLHNGRREGEYFEFLPEEKCVKLHVNRFSEYSLAKATSAGDNGNDGSGGGNNGGNNSGGTGGSKGGGGSGNSSGRTGGGKSTDNNAGNNTPAVENSGQSHAGSVNTSDIVLLNTAEHFLYVYGVGNNLFAPDKGMTRAEAAQMFYNLLIEQDVEITERFPDVPEGAWYTKAVETLASLDIITGYPDGNYYPDRNITRAEFAAIAVKFTETAQGRVQFSDVPDTHWAYSSITAAAGHKWINGVGDGRFEPDREITRAEAVTIVNTMLKRSPDKAFIDDRNIYLTRFTDIATHWAYYQIMEASNTHEFEIQNDAEKWKQQQVYDGIK